MADLPQRPISALPILAKIPIPGSPDWVGIGDDAIWISNIAKNNISRIDPARDKVVANVATGKAPCSGLGIGFGSVWVPCCGSARVDRVDPATNKVVASIATTIADTEGGIGVGDSGVWIPADKEGTVVQIDPATNKIVGRVDTVAGSVAAAVGEGAVWVTSPDQSILCRIDPKQQKVTAKIKWDQLRASSPSAKERCGRSIRATGQFRASIQRQIKWSRPSTSALRDQAATSP